MITTDKLTSKIDKSPFESIDIRAELKHISFDRENKFHHTLSYNSMKRHTSQSSSILSTSRSSRN